MGNWRITIEGCGCHHNKRPDDANEMAIMFARFLKSQGHSILSANFTLLNFVNGEWVVNPVVTPDDIAPK